MKKLTTKEFIENSKNIHGTKYDYSLVEYTGRTSKVKIICPIHGVFEQRPANHVSNKRGCPKCGNSRSGDTNRNNKQQFIDKANKVHKNKYDYSLVEYKGTNSKVKIICKKHGIYEQTPNSHLQNHGCPICAKIKNSKKQTKSLKDFIDKARAIYGDNYSYEYVNKVSNSTKIKVNCSTHGIFVKTVKNFLKGQGCPKCSSSVKISKGEKELYCFINDIVESIQSDRSVLNGKELDIFIPSKKLAVEYNGLYWHSSEFKNNSYHLNKTKQCNEKGIRLIHIFEDEWLNKKEIVKSRLSNFLGKSDKIYARKCTIKEVPTFKAMKFLDENHIQGKVGGKIKLGLYYEEDLVALMTFGKLRKNLGQTHKEGSWELLRFCNKLNINVAGGASKLLNFFKKNYNWTEIISYADLRWSQGDLYFKLGFQKIHEAYPNYYYIKPSVNLIRETRFKYRKAVLVKQGEHKDKSEKQIMEQRGYFRIYDCGTIKFSLKNT